jgi:hypothetical protein
MTSSRKCPPRQAARTGCADQVHGVNRPSRTRSDIPAVQRVIEAVKQGYGIAPLSAKSGRKSPDYVWTRILGAVCYSPLCNADENNHAPTKTLMLISFMRALNAP